jgi:diacylglycerol kinase (ATP)
MRTVGMMVNVAGGFGARKQERFRAFEDALCCRGADVHVFRTARPGIAAAALESAQRSGCQALLAVGGDGTFNDLLQAAIATRSDMPLGVLPFGSGNILAQEIHGGDDVERLAANTLSANAKPISIGKISAQTDNGQTTRYFAVAAGVGADARVICRIDPRLKANFGIAAYYAESTRQLLFSREPLPVFRVRFIDSDTGQDRDELVSQVVVERVSYFGRCLAGRNGHGLCSEGFRLVLFKTNRRAAFLAYGARMLVSRFFTAAHPLRDVEIAHAREIAFLHAPGFAAPVFAEVDGESIGQLPARIELIPDAFRLLMPGAAHGQQ